MATIETELEVVRLVEVLGRVEGRKRLQKLVHLLRAQGFDELKFRFVLHHYGPFSRDLAVSLDRLTSMKGLKEEEPGTSFSYVYTVPESAREVLTTCFGDKEPAWAGDAQKLNELETDQLEGVSTLVFLREQGKVGDALKEAFAKAKPRLVEKFDSLLTKASDLGFSEPTSA